MGTGLTTYPGYQLEAPLYRGGRSFSQKEVRLGFGRCEPLVEVSDKERNM
jgi:hypothetical protein